MSLTAEKTQLLIQAEITGIRWKSPDSARCIAIAETKKPRKKYTIIGDIEEPTVGQIYEFDGELSYNGKYHTNEIKLHAYRTILPTDTLGIERYLVDVAKWVGRPIARQIVNRFGADALAIIKSDPGRVAQAINGITLSRALQMQKSLLENEKTELAAVEVATILGASVSPRIAKKAIVKWGSRAGTIIKRNPFRLTEIGGIGFKTADEVWKKIGLQQDGTRRIASAVLYAIKEIHSDDGDTYAEKRIIDLKVSQIAGVRPSDGIYEILSRAKAISKRGDRGYSLQEIAAAERELAYKIRSLAANPEEMLPAKVQLDGLAEDQIEAAKLFEQSKVMILTGAPGTGKTYAIARFVEAVKSGDVALCAPTGKAAKQMTNSLAKTTGEIAHTIHSLLGPTVNEETGEFVFSHGPDNPLDIKTLVVDEFSMADIKIANQLIGALRSDARLLIVGDKHQLPSVGPGSVLRDLIAAGIPSYELTEIKRNAGLIVKACHTIKDGKAPKPWMQKIDLEAGMNWRHIEAKHTEEILSITRVLYESAIPRLDIADMIWDVQAISPMNERGTLSCKPLNELLQGILNPGRIVQAPYSFSVGDKVVRTKNGEVTGELIENVPDASEIEVADEKSLTGPSKVRVVNGDIGIVEQIDEKHIHVHFVNPERTVRLKRGEHHLQLAYCLTCHKMQGSEAKIVIVPLHDQYASSPIWTREWIYTAFSRAKIALITIGQIKTLDKAVARVGNTKRKTLLQQLMLRK